MPAKGGAGTTNDHVFPGATRFRDFGGTETRFVNASTGSDANDGLTAGTAFLTINSALQFLAMSSRASKLLIQIADGTYTEDIVIPSILGSEVYDQGDFSFGAVSLELRGNTAIPGNVILASFNPGVSTILANNIAQTLILDGFEIQGPGNGTAVRVTSVPLLIFRNVDISNAASGLIAQRSRVIIETSAAGGTWTVTRQGIASFVQSDVSIDRDLTITGLGTTGIGVNVLFQSRVAFFPGRTYTIEGVTGPGAFAGITASLGSFVQLVGTSTYNINNIDSFGTNFAIAISDKTLLTVVGAATFNFDDCSNAIKIEDDSTFVDETGSTYNYTTGTPSIVEVSPGSSALSANQFSNATIQSVEADTDYKYGHDFRYVGAITGAHSGVLPLNTTAFFTHSQLQSDVFTLYTAQQDEIVDKLEIVSRTSNGPGSVDTYTVFLNGVATTMVATVNSSTSGSTTTNPVTLTAGDTIGVRVVTDALGTAAQDIQVLMNVRKT